MSKRKCFRQNEYDVNTFICGRVAGVQKTPIDYSGDFRLLAGLAYYANSRGHPYPDWDVCFIKVFGFD